MANRRFCLTVLLLASLVSYAQVAGSLSGTVVDQNDAAVGNATVKVFIAGGKDAILTGSTNSEGRFTFPGLNPEVYDVGVEAAGFGMYTYRQAKVSPGQESALPIIKLQVQAVAQVIEVVADPQGVQLENAEISTTLTNTQIQNLPVLGRQITNLLETQPGVTSHSGVPTSINGLRASFTTFTMDGINVQDNFLRTNDLNYNPFRLTIDQVDEVTITTTNASAEFGEIARIVVES